MQSSYSNVLARAGKGKKTENLKNLEKRSSKPRRREANKVGKSHRRCIQS